MKRSFGSGTFSIAAATIVGAGVLTAVAVLGSGPFLGMHSAFAGPQGPPGPGFGPPPGGPGMFLAPEIMAGADTDGDELLSADEAAAATRKFVAAVAPKGGKGIDAEALAPAINRRIGPGDPNEGPGFFMAPMIIGVVDADADGVVTADEAAAFAAKLVADADTAKKKEGLDIDALTQAVNERIGPPPGFGPGGPGGPGGPPGFGPDREIVADFDDNGDGRLDSQERKVARAELKKQGPRGRPGFGPGRPGGPPGGPRGFRPPGFGGEEEPVKAGPRLSPRDVESYPDKPLYDASVVRTVFLQFENDDWEAEMEDFHGTDVEIPADMFVDGQKYAGVGVHFRGMSSYMGVQAGHKRSLNVSVDHGDEDQRLYGYKTLNLLNSHEDPSFLHTVLYSEIARSYIPAPKANFVRVVINGESWGLYVNAQQFDKIFVEENFGSPKGARWKVRGNPGADGGLRYVGEELEEYERRFEMKSGGKKDWKALVELCRVLDETPAEELKAAIEPLLDVEGVLWFLALDNALINNDGYWTRASDYSLFRDAAGKFRLIPHDMNEAFGPAMVFGPGGPGRGPGGPGGPGGLGRGPGGGFGRGPRGPGGPGGPGGGRPMNVDLDPLVGLTDARTPLRSRLLAVPEYKARYLKNVQTIADEWLDWARLGPLVARQAKLIEPFVREDTRKLSSLAAFQAAVADAAPPQAAEPPRGRPSMSLRTFADRRRAFLKESLNKAAAAD